MDTKISAGWARPKGARKDHWFDAWQTRSLCDGAEWFGPLHATSEAQCQKCAKVLAGRIETPEPVEADVVEDPTPEPVEDEPIIDAEPIEDEAPAKNMRDENLRLAWIKAFSDSLADYLKEMREDHLAMLVKSYGESGNKSFDVLLPDGTKVGSVSLAQAKGYDSVTDEAALIEWAEQFPDAVVTSVTPERVVPETVIPAVTTKRVDPRWLDELTKNALEGDDGELLNAEGELIPGIKRVPQPAPDKFSIRFEKNGRERIAMAYKRGQLSGLSEGTPLPQITAGDK